MLLLVLLAGLILLLVLLLLVFLVLLILLVLLVLRLLLLILLLVALLLLILLLLVLLLLILLLLLVLLLFLLLLFLLLLFERFFSSSMCLVTSSWLNLLSSSSGARPSARRYDASAVGVEPEGFLRVGLLERLALAIRRVADVVGDAARTLRIVGGLDLLEGRAGVLVLALLVGRVAEVEVQIGRVGLVDERGVVLAAAASSYLPSA